MPLTEQQEKWIAELVEAGYKEAFLRRHICLVQSQSEVNRLKLLKTLKKGKPFFSW